MAKIPTGKSKAPSGKNTSGRGQRDLKVKVKSARGRKLSSTRWLQRQLNDPYVKRATAEGYRGRAAYKIMELDDKYRFLVPGARIVDLGAAPGGWCQVAVKRCNVLAERSGKSVGTILGIDLQEMEPVAGCELYQLDFMDEGADEQVKEWQEQIKLGQWKDFVRSILVNHYDLAYRRPGAEGSVYQTPSGVIALPDAQPGTLDQAARALLGSVSNT